MGGFSARRRSRGPARTFEQTEALESYFRRLPRDQATACRLIYLDGKSQDEVAALLGYSKAYLSRLHRNALDSLSRDGGVRQSGQEREALRTESVPPLLPTSRCVGGSGRLDRRRDGHAHARPGTGGSSRRRSAAARRSARDTSAGPGSRARPIRRSGKSPGWWPSVAKQGCRWRGIG